MIGSIVPLRPWPCLTSFGGHHTLEQASPEPTLLPCETLHLCALHVFKPRFYSIRFIVGVPKVVQSGIELAGAACPPPPLSGCCWPLAASVVSFALSCRCQPMSGLANAFLWTHRIHPTYLMHFAEVTV